MSLDGEPLRREPILTDTAGMERGNAANAEATEGYGSSLPRKQRNPPPDDALGAALTVVHRLDNRASYFDTYTRTRTPR